MEIFALFMFLGIFSSLLIPETKRKTLEQLAGEVPGTPEYDPRLARGGPAEVYASSDPSREEAHIGEKGASA